MAGITATIELNDRISAKLENIHRCTDKITMGFESVGKAMSVMTEWQNIEGPAKMEQQISGIVQTAQKLAQMQDEITNRSYDTMVLSNNAAEDISNVNDKLIELLMRAEALKDMSTDGATEAEITSINNSLAATSSRMKNILNLQERINNALLADNMSEVNLGYSKLNDLVASTNTQLNIVQGIYTGIEGKIKNVNSELAVGIYNVNAAQDNQRQLNDKIEKTENSIKENTKQQENFNEKIEQGGGSAEKLYSKIKSAVGAYVSLQGIKKGLDLSDSLTSAKARIALMTDDGEDQKSLKRKIYDSAMRSRADYISTVNSAASLALNAGNAFNNNDEIIMFLEGINKQFAIGGKDAATQAGAMTQLTQAMASGVLRGDELNSVLEGASEIARQIERSMGWAESSIRDYAEDGLVTAEIVKNAVLGSIDETNKSFESMPVTFEQSMIMLKNKAVNAFEPVLDNFNGIINSESFQTTMDGIIRILTVASYVAIAIIDTIGQAAPAIIDNWDKISSAVYAAAFAVGAYTFAVKAAKVVTGAMTIATGTFGAGVLGIGIGAAIAGIAFGVLANKVGGVDIAFAIVQASAADLFEDMHTYILAAVNSFLDFGAKLIMFFNRVKIGLQNEFIDIKAFALVTFNNIIVGIESLLNKTFGTAYDVDITIAKNAAIQAERDLKISENNQKLADFEANMQAVINGRAIEFSELVSKYENNHNARQEKINQLYLERNGIKDKEENDIKNLLDEYNNSLSSLCDITANIASNTEEIKSNSDIADLIKDYHSRQATQKSTTQYITIDMTGQTNHISSSMELSTVTDGLLNSIRTAVAVSAEGT